ncbi:MAG TPA: response regulator transcription factor [Gemmatimonadaceae bacterium]|nr:response regulator transcription factor [Gemmatimonadaceae bacterium]
MTARPRLLLADDHSLLCEGLRGLLEPDNDVVGVVHDGRDVVETVERLDPDLVMLDISLPGKDGLTLTRELRAVRPDQRIIILTMHAERLYADEALRAGARAFLLKLASGAELRFAVSEVLAGRTYVTPLLASAAGASTSADAAASLATDGPPLTARQLEVLQLVGRGLTTFEVAQELGVSEKAVEFHKTRIKKTLGLSSNAALMRYAVAHNIV